MKSSMLYVLPVVFLVQKIDFTEPSNVLIAQIVFGGVQGLVLIICAYIYLQIKNRNDQARVTVPPATTPFGGATGEAQHTTVHDYDISQLRKFVQQVVIGMCIAVFLLVKWNIVPPLAIQCVLNPMNLFGNPLFKLFALGENPASHPRPFPEENPLGGLFPRQPTAPTTTPPPSNTPVETTPTETKNKKESKKSE